MIKRKKKANHKFPFPISLNKLKSFFFFFLPALFGESKSKIGAAKERKTGVKNLLYRRCLIRSPGG